MTPELPLLSAIMARPKGMRGGAKKVRLNYLRPNPDGSPFTRVRHKIVLGAHGLERERKEARERAQRELLGMKFQCVSFQLQLSDLVLPRSEHSTQKSIGRPSWRDF